MISPNQRSITKIEFLILVALIITPIFTFQESLALIFLEERAYINTSSTLTPWYIKGIKDLFFISIILISFLKILDSLSIKLDTVILLTIILLLIIMPAYYFHTDIYVYLSGVRWLIPFILIAFLFGQIDRVLLQKMGTILFYLFILHFIMQVIQFFFSYGYWGLNFMGLSERNTGIFYIPSTAAIFSIMTLFFSKYYMNKNLSKKIFYLIPVSILLTSSGTGVGVYLIFFVIYYLKKNYIKYLPVILIILGIILLFLLDYFPGRVGLVEQSLGPRYSHLKEAIIHATLLPQYFGYGTATAELINNKYNYGITLARTDSFYASLVVNVGIINSLLMFVVLTALFFRLISSQDREKLLFFVLCSLIALTSSITESYPMNLIFSVLIAYYIDPKSNNEKNTNKTLS